MAGKIILIGAKPPKSQISNPGGQLTASLGVIEYAQSIDCRVSVIDTTQSSFPIPPLKDRVFRGLGRVKQLWEKLGRRDVCGVIIFTSSGFSFYERIILSVICRIFQVPDVFFVRSGHFYREIKQSVLKRNVAKLLLRIPHVIGAQGQDWVRFYCSLGVHVERTVIVRNWLSVEHPRCERAISCNPRSVVKFVFVGWLVDEKGVRQLLKAAHTLSKSHRFVLQIIGGGTLLGFCRDFVESNALQNCITIHGWKDKAFIIETLKNSHVFVLPSEAEGFPNAFLEAMALGLPGICTQVGGIPDSLKSGVNGYLLKDNSAPSISLAMKNYIDMPELIHQHSASTIDVYNSLHDRDKNCRILFSQFRV